MILPIFNDYLVFADEAGDHLLRARDKKEFPVFVLAFCVIERHHYANFIVPRIMELKLKYFQDPHVILHERDIRKATGDFEFLTGAELREAFFNDLNDFMRQAEFKVIASVIRKDQLQGHRIELDSLYYWGTKLCLEMLLQFLDSVNQKLEIVVTFEAREARREKEDRHLSESFLKITNELSSGSSKRFRSKIIPKVADSYGTQLADMIAHPIGRHILNPRQRNRAFDIIQSKFCRVNGEFEGYGLKVVP